MKKMLSVLMVLTVLLSMFACLGVQAAAAEEAETEVEVEAVKDEITLLAVAGDALNAESIEALTAEYERVLVLSVDGLTAGEVPQGYDVVWFAEKPEQAEDGYVSLYPGAVKTLTVGEKTAVVIGVDEDTDVEQLEELAGEADYVIAVGPAAAAENLADVVDVLVTAGAKASDVSGVKTAIAGEGEEPVAVVTVAESGITFDKAAIPMPVVDGEQDADEEETSGEDEDGDLTEEEAGQSAGEDETDIEDDEQDAEETTIDATENESENNDDIDADDNGEDDNNTDTAEQISAEAGTKAELEARMEDAEDLSWTLGSAEGISVTFTNAAVDTVSVGPKGEDKETVSEGRYELDNTNKQVTFTTAYLNGLSAGDYEMEFTFQEDDAATYLPLTAELTVLSAEAGDNNANDNDDHSDDAEETASTEEPENTTEPTETPNAEPKNWDRSQSLVLTYEGRTPTGVSVFYGVRGDDDWRDANSNAFTVSGNTITLLPALINGGGGLGNWKNGAYKLRISFTEGDPVIVDVTVSGTAPVEPDSSTPTTNPTATAKPSATPAPTNSGEKAPATGDENPIGLYVVILLVLVVALAVVIIILVKRKKNDR